MKKSVRGRSAKTAKPTESASHAPRPPTAAEKTPSGKWEATVTVVNKRGLHARAAAKFVKLAGDFLAEIRVTAAKGGLAGGAIVSGRSIMGLMMLAAGPGSELHIEAEGIDAAKALAALTRLVEGGFDEDD